MSRIDPNVNRFKLYQLSCFVIPFFCDSLFQSEMFELPEGICLYFKSNFQTCLTYLILEINVMSAGLILDFVFYRSSRKRFFSSWCYLKKDRFNQFYTFRTLIQTKSIFWDQIQDLVLFPVFWRNHFRIVFFITLFSRLKMKLFLC